MTHHQPTNTAKPTYVAKKPIVAVTDASGNVIRVPKHIHDLKG